MKIKNETFDKVRLYVEIIGHVLAFAVVVSEIIGFKYGIELAAIVEGFNIMLGGILNSLRNQYNAEALDDGNDE